MVSPAGLMMYQLAPPPSLKTDQADQPPAVAPVPRTSSAECLVKLLAGLPCGVPVCWDVGFTGFTSVSVNVREMPGWYCTAYHEGQHMILRTLALRVIAYSLCEWHERHSLAEYPLIVPQSQ